MATGLLTLTVHPRSSGVLSLHSVFNGKDYLLSRMFRDVHQHQ